MYKQTMKKLCESNVPRTNVKALFSSMYSLQMTKSVLKHRGLLLWTHVIDLARAVTVKELERSAQPSGAAREPPLDLFADHFDRGVH